MTDTAVNEVRTTHTPGEWFVHARLDEGLGTLVLSKAPGRDDIIICDCHSWEWMDNAQENANARLIAAAPELLSALHQLHSFVAIMVGHGPDASIPDTISTPLGVPVKVGEIMRAADAAIASAESSS